jgi:hypothetical protein
METRKVREICQACKHYNRKTKKCDKAGIYTSRKGTCKQFNPSRRRSTQ